MIANTLRRIPYWLLVLVCGSALLFPLLWSYGLWDPAEVSHADVAREMAQNGGFLDVTHRGRFMPRPPLPVWTIAAGFKLFGVNEAGGRLPLAMVGLGCLMLIYWVGARLFRPRVGLLAALVLGTGATFILQSRQMMSDVVPTTCALAAAGGLGLWAWPRDRQRRTGDLLVGLLGLGLGYLAAGALLGVVVPLGGVLLAVLLSCKSRLPAAATVPANPEAAPASSSDGATAAVASTSAAAQATSQAPAPATTSLGRALFWPMVIAAGIVVVLVVLVAQAIFSRSAAYSSLIGALPRRAVQPAGFDYFLRQLGFAFFPWCAFLPFALGRLLLAQGNGKTEGSAGAGPGDQRAADGVDAAGAADVARSRFGKLLCLTWAAVAFFVGTYYAIGFGDLRFPALPALALAVGVLLDETLASRDRAEPLLAFGVTVLSLMITRDFYFYPESLATAHVLETIKWPQDVRLTETLTGMGIALAVPAFALYFFSRQPLAIGWAERWRWLRWLGFLRPVHTQIARFAPHALVLVSLGFAFFIADYLTPLMSRHLSYKGLFLSYSAARQGKQELAQYRVVGRGAVYYNNGHITDLGTQQQLLDYLRRPERVFVILPSSELGPLDQASRQQSLPYNVVDDRNSRYLLISNRLAGSQPDRNPLKTLVTSAEPRPQHLVKGNFEDKVELLGWDGPDSASTGSNFQLTLYYKVLAQMPANWKVFIHFDGPGNRFFGDHEPLGGKLPTQYWTPGVYITDPTTVDVDRMTTSTGDYAIWMGFWQGEERLKVRSGPSDNSNRIRLGTLRVK